MRRLISSLAVFAVLASSLAGAAAEPGWRAKVAPRLLEQLEHERAVEYLIVLREQADLSQLGLDAQLERGERARRVIHALQATAARTQPDLIGALAARGATARPFWIANLIWVRGNANDLEHVARRADVVRIDANPRVSLGDPVAIEPSAGPAAARAVEWSLSLVGVDQLWTLGIDGSGVVIGGQDTGYEWNHPAIRDQYRGWDGTSATHDYNWHDSIHVAGSSCGADSPQPCDDHDHGTHTMGTMVGDDGGSNQIGVAPGARWIGCRNMNAGDGTPASYTECFEWFVAPTDLSGGAPDPTLAPHVINNSWSCPPSEGCSPDTMRLVVENTRAAGIVVVVSAGNSGSVCGSVARPAAIFDASLTVGATNSGDEIAGFSSRGPVLVDGSGRPKPDVSAPGVGVRSSIRGGGYASFSGTSMAGPHVSGLVALLLSARPDLAGDVDTIEALILDGAVPLSTLEGCGDDGVDDVPNNTFGAGRIDATATLFGDLDGDGIDNFSDCRPADATVWSKPAPIDDLRLGGALTTVFDWTAPAPSGGQSPRVELLRSPVPDVFSAADCLDDDAIPGVSSDPSVPAEIAYYLLRVRNACGHAVGGGPGNVERTVSGCP